MINKRKETSSLLPCHIKTVLQGNQKVDNGKFFTGFHLINAGGVTESEKHRFPTLGEAMD